MYKLITLLALLPERAAAAYITSGIPGCDFASGRVVAKCIPNFLAHLIRFFFSISGAVFIIMIIIAGYQMVIGNLPGGNTEGGKNRLTWAVIGFLVSACAIFILSFIINAIATGP